MSAGSEQVHARAPLRISFAGGGTDVPPYPQRVGGAVLSATIDWAAYAAVVPTGNRQVTMASPDLSGGAVAGREQLTRVVVDDIGVAGDGAHVTTFCDAPPGSGLGSSSSLIVAMAAALAEYRGQPSSPYELAERAVRLERDDLGVPGGLQDQYAAVFGGFNFIEFRPDGVLVNPLRLQPDVAAELHGCLVLVPAPQQSRRSSGILTRQIAQTTRGEAATLARLDRIRAQAVEMKACLLRGDLRGMAALLHEGWMSKRELTNGITTDAIDRLYATAQSLGALGGKLLGAGGGGYLLLMVPFDARGGFVRALRDRGVDPLSFSFTELGVQAWHADA